MNKTFAFIAFTAFVLIGGCHQKTDTTEVIPAQLELNWMQTVDNVNSQELKTTVPVEMAQQFAQIGEYRSSSQITYTNQTAKVEFKLVFMKEIQANEMQKLLPQIRSIFKEKAFQATFHGKQEKHVIQESYGLFPQTEKRP